MIYSLIMLNTDLHNPAVQPKMSVSEFQASLYRVEILRALSPARIARMYEAVQACPLQIDPTRAGVDTIIRASNTDDACDEVTPALLSRYSQQRTRTLNLIKDAAYRAGKQARALGSESGRRDFRFQLKRWHGRNYAEIRVLALVLVMCGFVFAIWGSESAPSTAAADEQDDEAVGVATQSSNSWGLESEMAHFALLLPLGMAAVAAVAMHAATRC